MKKLLSAILITTLLLCSVFALASCGELELDGKYVDAFGDDAIEFDGNKFTVYEIDNKSISVSGTFKLAYDDDGEVDKIKFTLDDENDADIERFAFLSKEVCEFDYEKEMGKIRIEIDDADFIKQ